jgi:hypothetical protein
MVDRLPGVEGAEVVAIHDVLDGTRGAAGRRGRRVLVLDDLNDWRGLGTALALAEAGHETTIVTSAPVVAGGLFHSAADGPLRARYAAAGGRSVPSAVITGWEKGRATLRSLPAGVETTIEADTLVIAETAISETILATDLTARGIDFHLIGDAVAPRRASLAFYEGRELAQRL